MRIYVSSTSEDLREYRAAVVQQLRGLGHEVVSMEGYTADARSPVEKCLTDVASADAYVGLFAFHYGTVPPGYDYAITEMEFRTATEQALPRLIFLVPDDVENWPFRFIDRGEAGMRMDRLRRELLTQHGFTAAFFSNQTELLTELPKAINGVTAPSPRTSAASSVPGECYREWVKPLSFDAERSRHLTHFTGREWVEEKLDDWIIRQPKSKVFCLLGGPGIGKSAIACHWCHVREDILAYHHCVHGHAEKTDPKRILLSLAAQMAANSPEYEKRLSEISINELKEIVKGDANTVFDNLLMKLFSSSFPAPGRTQLVVIDGLDEASHGQDNELANFIGQVWGGLPDWLRLVVTSRPETTVIDYLGSLHPFILNASSRENLQDIRSFLRRELESLNASDLEINQIVEKSEGMFLYAYLVLDEIRAQRLTLQQTDDFPEGLTGYYKGWFSRKFPDPDSYHQEMHKLVSVIVAQKAPLPWTVLAGALGLSSYDLNQRLIKLGVLFPPREEVQGTQKVKFVTLMHKSLHDWLTEINPATLYPRAGAFAADPDLGNELLAEEGWRVYTAGKLAQHPYFIQTLLPHLAETRQTERLAAVLLDPALLDTLWSNDYRTEWQRYISGLRHALSLTRLVQDWLAAHGSATTGTVKDAVVAGKLCRLFQEMGAYDEAILLAEAALAIWQAHHVGDSPDMVGTLLALGRIQSVRDQLADAEASYEKALAIAEQAYAPDSQQMADVLYDLCIFYTQGKRDYAKASDCLERCLVIRSNGNPPDYVGMANCINDRAVIRTRDGRPADYLGIYLEALAIFEKSQPHGHPEMVSTLGNAASQLHQQGKLMEALKLFERAVKMAEDILLPQHEYSNSSRYGLASLLLDIGRYDEALDIVRTHVTELERFPGPDHDDTAGARLVFCQTLLNAIHLSDATGKSRYRDEFRQQVQCIRRAKPATVLGLLSLATGAESLAESGLRDFLLETARQSSRSFAAMQHKTTAEAVSANYFAEMLEAVLSERSLAELAPELLAIWEQAMPEMQHEADCLPKARKRTVALISWIGRVRLSREDDIEAIHQAFELIDRIGAESPDTLDHLATLTVSLHSRHHEDVSETLCRRLIEKSEKILGPEHNQTLTYLENLAHYAMHRGNLQEAERLFHQAFDSRVKTMGVEQSNTLAMASALTECLLLQDDVSAAQEFIRDLTGQLPADTSYSSARSLLARHLASIGIDLKNEFAQYAASRACYELALEIDPNNAGTHNNMAMLLWVCLHDPAAAAEYFKKSLTLNPDDGNTHSNYATLLSQTLNHPEQAGLHFDKASSLNPNLSAIPANYAAFHLLQGDLTRAWNLSQRAMQLCLPAPDRIMARPLFIAASILLLREKDASVPLGQLKTLFSRGIDHVTWVITALQEMLNRQLPPESGQLMHAVFDAMGDGTKLEALDALPAWQAIHLVPFDAPWPVL